MRIKLNQETGIKRTKQIKARVTEAEQELLNAYCKDKGITVSDLIRIAIDKYVEDAEKAESEE